MSMASQRWSGGTLKLARPRCRYAQCGQAPGALAVATAPFSINAAEWSAAGLQSLVEGCLTLMKESD